MLPPLPSGKILMHQSNTILMVAPKEIIFDAAANLERWPTFLPHYRYIRYLERGPVRNIVQMAAKRGMIPISWLSEQIIDREKCEVRFRHLRAFTKGMEVVWTFDETAEGVRVEIEHQLRFRVPYLRAVAEPIIGRYFIDYVASRTLKYMKAYVENR